MKLSKTSQSNDSKMLFSMDEEKIAMKIDNRAAQHIINRLTDLYSNPIEATAREIISNAIDTTKNISEEKRKPIIVELPSTLNPSFVVHDSGEGMSKDEIRDIYSQYGASTKSTDMNQIGAYGLGAKSPLSYCSQFTVESTKDGITTELIVSSESEGNYTRFVKSENEGRSDGTKVTIPVSEDDIKSFSEAVSTYKTFAIDVDIIIDGEERDDSSLVLAGYIPIPSISDDFKLRVFTLLDNKKFIDTYVKDDFLSEVGYFLSGWNYTKSTSRYESSNTRLYIELVPGIVDFSSSRDEITENDRFFALNTFVKARIEDVTKSRMNELISDGVMPNEDILAAYGAILSSGFSRVKLDNIPKENLYGMTDSVRSVFTEDEEKIIDFSFFIANGRNSFIRGTACEVDPLGYTYYRGSEMTATEVKSRIDRGHIVATPKSIFHTFRPYSSNTVVIVETNGDDTNKAIVNRLRNYIKNASINEVRVLTTKLTEDEVKSKLDGFVVYDDFLFMDDKEFKTKAKVARAPSAPRKKVKKLVGKIEGEVYQASDAKEMLSCFKYSWSMNDSSYIDMKTIEASTAKNKMLFLYDGNTVGHRKSCLRFIVDSVDNKGESIFISLVHRKELTASNVEEILGNFDSVAYSDKIKLIGKKVIETINAKPRVPLSEEVTIDSNSYLATVDSIKRIPSALISMLSEQNIKGEVEEIVEIFNFSDSQYYSSYMGSGSGVFRIEKADEETELAIKIRRILSKGEEYREFFRKLRGANSEIYEEPLMKFIIDDVNNYIYS